MESTQQCTHSGAPESRRHWSEKGCVRVRWAVLAGGKQCRWGAADQVMLDVRKDLLDDRHSEPRVDQLAYVGRAFDDD